MIAFVKGILDTVDADRVVVENQGVGFEILVPGSVAEGLPETGNEVKLYTYTSVREDAFWLYGFLSRNDLEIFKKCITVNGIGPKGALSILSVLDADSLIYAIVSGDAKAIAKAPGVGLKTAERLILELKGKIDISDDMIGREAASYGNLHAAADISADTPQKREAIEALVSLGYNQVEALKAVNAIENIEEMDSGAVLKAALKKMF